MAEMLNLAEAKRTLWEEVCEDGELLHCFNCSSCISGCPASEADPPLLIRNLARMVILGLEEELLEEDSPWLCVTCSRCEEMCPQDVKPFELLLSIRRWQCREDETRLPQVLPELFERGYTQPVEGGEIRKMVGLEKLATLSDFPELLERFRAMLMEVQIVKQNDYMFRAGE
jgi:heterodisulfide reductase subunit C